LIEARNNADNTAYAGEKALREFGDKVPTEVRSDVEARIAEAKSAAQGEDVEQIKAATEVLSLAVQKIGASVYEQAQATPEGEAGSDPNPNPNPDTDTDTDADAGPEVIDGEVKE